MKIDSDLKLELMPMEEESTESYIARLRDLQVSTTLRHVEAQQALIAARLDLKSTRQRNAGLEEINEVYDTVMAFARAAGKARYEKEALEFALSEVFHTVNR